MIVTVVEKWNGKIYKTDYRFTNVEDKNKFIELCESYNCIAIERKTMDSNKAG